MGCVLDDRSARPGILAAGGNAAEARGYAGVVCLPAEYTDEAAVDRLIAEDIVFAKTLF